MSRQQEVVKDVRTAIKLEQELQVLYALKGVAVLDIYSSEWGPCKALAETFRRLNTEESDGAPLRFFSVECNAVIDSLENPQDEQRQHQRPKNTEAIKDTLPDAWKPIIEERRGQSKPYFLFFKEGKRVAFVEGVNTPLIRSTTKDLCQVKTPASEFVTNSKLLEFWEEYFPAEESETTWDKFNKALTAVCKLTVTLNDEERTTLGEAIGISKDRTVNAEGLQKWFGDDETRTVLQAFTDTLPDYEERAQQVRLEREADEKRKAEEDEKRKAEEDAKKAEEERVAAEERQREEEEAKANQPSAEETIRRLDEEIADLLSKIPEIESAEAAAEGDADAAIRSAAVADVSELVFAPKRLELLEKAAATEASQAAAAAIRETAALSAELTAAGATLVGVAAARSAVDGRDTTANTAGCTKLALELLTTSGSDAKALVNSETSYADLLLDGTALEKAKGVATTAITDGVVDGRSNNKLYFVGDISGVAAEEGAEVVLPPLTALLAAEEEPSKPEGDAPFNLTTVVGLDKVIDFSGTRRGANGVVATHWYTAVKVESKATEDNVTRVTLQFDSVVDEETFMSAAAGFATNARDDDIKLQNITSIQAKSAERAEAAKNVPEKPAEESKPEEAPASEEKPAEENKPADEEKPAEEKPAEESKPEEAAEESKPEEAPAASEEKPAEDAKPEEAPAAEDKPAEEEKPAEEKPTEESKPEEAAEESKPEEAPAAEEKPAEDAKPEEAPATEEKPAEESKPEETPAAEEKPAEDAKPADEEKPAEESKPDDQPAEEKPAEEAPAAEEAKPAEDSKPEEAPASEEKPAEEPKPEEAPAAEDKPAEEEKPAEEAPAAEEKPAEESESKPEEAPAAEEKPAEDAKPEEAPATEEKPAEESKPAEEEKPKEDETPAFLSDD